MKSYVGRLPAWEAERGIRHTMDLYAHAMDYGKEEIWCDCFTDDALFLVNDAQKNFDEIYRVQGAKALAAYIAAYPSPPVIFAKHICSQILIQVDGDTASSESFWLAINSSGGEEGGQLARARDLHGSGELLGGEHHHGTRVMDDPELRECFELAQMGSLSG